MHFPAESYHWGGHVPRSPSSAPVEVERRVLAMLLETVLERTLCVPAEAAAFASQAAANEYTVNDVCVDVAASTLTPLYGCGVNSFSLKPAHTRARIRCRSTVRLGTNHDLRYLSKGQRST